MTPNHEPRIWYKEPDCLKIRLEPNEADFAALDHDTIITKKIKGEDMIALVPTHALPESRNWVPVQFAGKHQGNIIVYFPVSNEGRPTWVIPEDEFKSIAFK